MKHNVPQLTIYLVLSVFLLVAQEQFIQMLIVITGLFAAWRLLVLISHGLTCATCQFKFIGALLLFLSILVLQVPRISYLVVVLLWFDYFTKDKHANQQATFY